MCLFATSYWLVSEKAVNIKPVCGAKKRLGTVYKYNQRVPHYRSALYRCLFTPRQVTNFFARMKTLEKCHKCTNRNALLALNNCCFALFTSRHKESVCEKTVCSVFLCDFLSRLHASHPFPTIHCAQGPFQKGLILQVNLSLSQQRQTSQWGKYTPPWWLWSTTGRARSSAHRPFVTSRYSSLLVQCVHLLSSEEPVGGEPSF